MYYNPEKYGLAIFDEIDVAGAYEFDKLVVWQRNRDGRLLWALDSGCS